MSQPALTIRARWNPSVEPFECQLVPLKFTGYSNFDPMSKFLMWEMPEQDEVYGLGVDTSDGIAISNPLRMLCKCSQRQLTSLVASGPGAYPTLGRGPTKSSSGFDANLPHLANAVRSNLLCPNPKDVHRPLLIAIRWRR